MYICLPNIVLNPLDNCPISKFKITINESETPGQLRLEC